MSEVYEVGPQLDAAVAEKVMGWEFDHTRSRPPSESHIFPEFSTEIAASWLVVDKMREQIFSKRAAFANALKRCCPTHMGSFIAWPEAIMWIKPEDICRAALAAMEPKP